MIDKELIERCARIPTSTWSDALDRVGAPGVITGLALRAGSLPLAGPIRTVAEAVGPLGSASPDDFGIGHILGISGPGDVVLIRQEGSPAASAIGGLAALAARRHGIAGIVIDGACRDLDELRAVGLPIVSRELTPASGRGRVRIGGLDVPLRFGELEVRPGDLLVADETGVVVIGAGQIAELVALAEERAGIDEAQAADLGGIGPQT